MEQSYEYGQFINEKVIERLPINKIRIGNKYNFRCPLCGDSKKSSQKRRGWYYLQSHSYYCFNCSTGMSGIRFLEAISGQEYEEIKREYLRLFAKSKQDFSLSSRYEIPSEEPSIFELKSIVLPEWKNPLSENAKAYLDQRLVTKAPFFNTPLYTWTNKKQQEYILIPWQLNGVDAYYQLNDFEKHGAMKYLFPKDKKKLIAGLDNIDISWPYIIVFEGFYDSLFVKNGICSGTKSITDYQLKLIQERYPKHQICISFDNDRSGLESMVKLIKQNKDFKFFRWFNENTSEKDINDYIKAKGDVNIFTDPKKLQRMIVDQLVMKMWLIRNGHWNIKKL